jgi:tetratricopeptide (TPR) repeat protein
MAIALNSYLDKSLQNGAADAHFWKNLGDRKLQARDFVGAAADYREALRHRSDLVEALNNLGITWKERGHWAKASACFQRVLRLDPACGAAFNNLGNALKGQDKLEDASAAYEQARLLLPDNDQVVYNLALTLHERGELDQAAACYHQALRLHPGYVEASNNLATLLKEQGRFDEAIAQYRATLKIQPDYPLTIYNLSELAAGGRFHFDNEEVNRIRTCLSAREYPPVDQSLFHFTLATLLNQKGHYDEAFDHYRQANEIRERLHAEQDGAFDAQSHQTRIDYVLSTYDQSYFRKVRGWGVDSEAPIFIVGMPRSGSTLVEQILASLPGVHGVGEMGEMPKFLDKWARHSDDMPAPSDARAAQAMATAYLERLAQMSKGAGRVVVKALDNYLHLGLIATLFPRAHIIHCRRDPLDLCLSCYFQNFQGVSFAWTLENIGVRYRCYEKVMEHWKNVLPSPIHEVCYEDLVYNQKAVTRELLAFCGLDWDDRCLSFHKTRRDVLTASNVQVRNPLSKSSVGRWKKYRAHLAPLFTALGLKSEEIFGTDFPANSGSDAKGLVQSNRV